MLENLLTLSQSLNSFDTYAEVSNIVDENGQILVKLQKSQLAKGVDNTGLQRKDSYRPLTVFIKKQFGKGLGAVVDRVTFFMTGELYSSLFYSRRKEKYSIRSNEETYTKMLERVGEDKFGLSPESRTDFAKGVLLPDFGKVFERKTGLKI